MSTNRANATGETNVTAAKPAQKPKPNPRPLDGPKNPTPPVAGKRAAPGPRAKTAAVPPTEKEAHPPEAAEHEERQDEPQRRVGIALTGWLLAVPSWLVSLIFHVVLLMLLALLTFSNKDMQQELFQTSSIDKEEVQELEDFEFEDQPIEVLEPTTFEAATLNDVGMADIGDITAPETSLKSDVAAHESVEAVELGQLFGEDGIGMAEVGTGDGATTFFGVRTEGNHFMYVVDNSNSMNNGKFENAVYELMQSIEQLPETSFFYIIFYSDTAYPLFYPQSVPRWVRATPENKHKVRYWLDTVHRCLQTRGEGAMAHAMKLRPDVLYLLGDGAFTDKAAQKTLELADEVDVTINTLGFNMKPEHAKDFARIAEAFGGNFRSVDVDPRMKKIAKQKNRPKNRTQNGDWGIKLGKK